MERVELDGKPDEECVGYDAQGQGTFILCGNGVMTRHAYDDKETLRRERMRTERYAGPPAAKTLNQGFVPNSATGCLWRGSRKTRPVGTDAGGGVADFECCGEASTPARTLRRRGRRPRRPPSPFRWRPSAGALKHLPLQGARQGSPGN